MASIIKRTRPEERETTTGRIVTRTVTTWDLVDERGLVSEHTRRRDARSAREVYQYAAKRWPSATRPGRRRF